MSRVPFGESRASGFRLPVGRLRRGERPVSLRALTRAASLAALLTIGNCFAAPEIAAVTNAASYATGQVSPGMIVTIFGSGFTQDTQVLVDGQAAPVLYTFPRQMAAIVPYTVAGKAAVEFRVADPAGTSAAVPVSVVAASPGIFTAGATGTGQAAMTDPRAVPPGSVITFYITGEGPLDPPATAGAIAASPNRFQLPVKVRIGGKDAPVQYAGSSPGSVFGLGQINAVIPEGVSSGAQPLEVEVGGARSLAGVTVAIAPTGLTTIFLIHGLGQGPDSIAGLAGSLSGPLGVDPSRFTVDSGFDFSECTRAGFLCPSNCSLPGGTLRLRDYVARRAPSGPVVLVGFSLGGLLARELISSRMIEPGRVNALITLATPHLGYPFSTLDGLAFCPAIAEGMNGNWRTEPPQISGYLSALTAAWNSDAYPGAAGRWLTAAGRSCSNPVRALNPSTGCRDSNPFSDGVVCADSATYNIVVPAPARPTELWQDPNREYVHSTSGGGLFPSLVLCGNNGRAPLLIDPPPAGSLFAAIKTAIQGTLTTGNDELVRTLLNASNTIIPSLVDQIRQSRSEEEMRTLAELIAIAGDEPAVRALRLLESENPRLFAPFVARALEHARNLGNSIAGTNEKVR